MAEWSKAAVLKTVSRQRDVGSNPTPSAIKSLRDFIYFLAAADAAARFETFGCQNNKISGIKDFEVLRRDGRVGRRRSPAKRVYSERGIPGSNPGLSATPSPAAFYSCVLSPPGPSHQHRDQPAAQAHPIPPDTHPDHPATRRLEAWPRLDQHLRSRSVRAAAAENGRRARQSQGIYLMPERMKLWTN